jgi:hypothetical protein
MPGGLESQTPKVGKDLAADVVDEDSCSEANVEKYSHSYGKYDYLVYKPVKNMSEKEVEEKIDEIISKRFTVPASGGFALTSLLMSLMTLGTNLVVAIGLIFVAALFGLVYKSKKDKHNIKLRNVI